MIGSIGLKPSQPKKPMQNANEINDEIISGMMLGLHKGSASGKAMAACETTNPVVRRVLADSVPNCIEMAYELSIYQNQHHYYQVPQYQPTRYAANAPILCTSNEPTKSTYEPNYEPAKPTANSLINHLKGCPISIGTTFFHEN